MKNNINLIKISFKLKIKIKKLCKVKKIQMQIIKEKKKL